MLALNARDTTLAIVAPLVLWGAHFTLCYVAVAVACARGWEGLEIAGINAVHLATGALTAVVLALIGWSIASHLRFRRHGAGGNRHFMAGVCAAVGAVSFVSTLWVAFPILFLPLCATRGFGGFGG